jgi:hypothetical protein
MKNGDQQAFPRPGSEHTNLADNVRHEPTEGLTKREYFAAMAMQGLLSSWTGPIGEPQQQHCAELSVTIADELLKQLES